LADNRLKNLLHYHHLGGFIQPRHRRGRALYALRFHGCFTSWRERFPIDLRQRSNPHAAGGWNERGDWESGGVGSTQCHSWGMVSVLFSAPSSGPGLALASRILRSSNRGIWSMKGSLLARGYISVSAAPSI